MAQCQMAMNCQRKPKRKDFTPLVFFLFLIKNAKICQLHEKNFFPFNEMASD